MSAFTSLSKCPNCHANQLKLDNNGNYVCRACDQVFSAAQIEGTQTVKTNALAGVISAAVREIDSPESAIIYLETFFASYDWKAYAQTPDIYIDDLRVMVEKNKVKHPGDPKTWELEIGSIVYPVQKKIEALNDLQTALIEKYHGDISDVVDEFSAYNSVVGGIEEARDAIVLSLDSAIANMKRFGANAEDIKEAEESIAAVKAAISEAKAVNDVQELPLYQKHINQSEAKVVAAYSAKGINAEASYNAGLRAFELKNYSDAIAYFENITDYRDSKRYITLINTCFAFGEIVEAGGKTFKLDYHKEILGAVVALGGKKGCKKKKEEAPAEPAEEPKEDHESFDLFEIVNAAPAEKPSIAGFSEIICTYGDNIYYIKGKDKLCVYNVKSGVEKELDNSKYGYNTKDKDSMGLTFSKDKLYIKKVLEPEQFKKGCFNNKKKEAEFNKSQQNNYSMLLIDLRNAEISVAIEKMVTCLCLRDYIFFTVSEVVSEDKKNGKTYENIAKMHNLASGTTEILFEKKCEILSVNGTKVIYDTWHPNSLNRELRVIDYKTHEDTLLEANVFQYIRVTDNGVLYTVGNKNYSSLFHINLDGTKRVEIQPNFKKAQWTLDVMGTWLYMTRGSVIIKVSLEDQDKLVLAIDVKKIIRISGNFVYYISTNSEFRVVRLDGENNIVIAPGLTANDVSIGVTDIYYLRSEWVGDKTSKSLYRMDSDGHNVRKVLFDVDSMKDKNPDLSSSLIYILKNENKKYKITIGEDSHFEYFDVSSYYTLNKATGAQDTLLVLGAPNAENYADLANSKERGCLAFIKSLFKKKKVKDVIVEEVEKDVDYGQLTEEEGKAFGGVFAAVVNNNEETPADSEQEGNKNPLAGCKNGCASIFSKFKKK